MEKKYETEILYNGIQVQYQNSKTLFHEKSDLQDLVLFENPILGKVLMLDGVTQVTEADEFIYHEMMTHVPIFAHDNPQNILIIGGGDGGIAREVLRHNHIKSVVMIEIDQSVIDFSRKHMPKISRSAFDDPRLNLKIADGALFVKETDRKFDIIIVDSTDPHGPGEVLFTKDFYKNCHRILNSNGILVTQNGVPFVQSDELKQSIQHFRDIFKFSSCYRATIPTYAFGEMAMGWASDKDYSSLNLEILKKRFSTQNLDMSYYNSELHLASFVLPSYIKKIIDF